MKFYIGLLLFLSIALAACSEIERPDGIILFEDETSFIELVSVDDSRCPSDLTCIWAGNAAVAMRLHQNSIATDFVLHSNPGENTGAKEMMVEEYSIELIDVNPFPTSETLGTIDLEEYSIELNVSF